MDEVHLTDLQYRRIHEARTLAPEDRLSVLWSVYEESSGRKIGRPPLPAERGQVAGWMRAVQMGAPLDRQSASPPWIHYEKVLRQSVYGTTSEKQAMLAMRACRTCDPIVGADGTYALAITMPLNVAPWSRQSTPDHAAIRDALRHELKAKRWLRLYRGEALCVRISSRLASGRNLIDADNLVKGVLDAMQEAVYDNDRAIQCLTSHRLLSLGSEGSITVSVWGVHPYSADIAFDDPSQPTNLAMPSRIGRQ